MRARDIVEFRLCFSHQPIEIVVAIAAGDETMLEPGELVPDLRERTYQRLEGIRGGSQVGAGHAVRLQPAFVVGRCP